MVATENVPEVAARTSDAIVEIRELNKTYRLMLGKEIQAVSQLSLTINKGETFAIVGPNGSGKTTTLKTLLGLLFPTEGDVSVFGLPAGHPDVQARIGYLPEAPYFYEYLNGRELLELYGKLCGVPADMLSQRIDNLLRMVDLLERGADMPIRVSPVGCASASASPRR